MSSIFQGLVTPDQGLVKFDVGTTDVTVSSATLTGSSGDYFSTPDSVDNSIRQSITLEVDAESDDWTGAGSTQALITKFGSTTERCYALSARGTGTLLFAVSPDGTSGNQVTFESVPHGFIDGTRYRIRVDLDIIANRASFYVDDVLLSSQVLPVASIFDSATAAVEVGTIFAGTADIFEGTVYDAKVIKGPTPYPYVLLDGVVGTYSNTPAKTITGSVRFEAKIKPVSVTATQTIASQWETTGDQRAWIYRLNSAQTLGIQITDVGTSAGTSYSSSELHPFTDGEEWYARCDLNFTDGFAYFYTSEDGENWQQLGSPVAVSETALAASSAEVEVGGLNDGSSSNFEGIIGYASVSDLTTLNPILNFDPQPYLQGDSTFVAPETGETWTLQGNAIATSPIDDGLKVWLNPNAYQGGDTFFVGQLGSEIWANPPDFVGGAWTDLGRGAFSIAGGTGNIRMDGATDTHSYLAEYEIDNYVSGNFGTTVGGTVGTTYSADGIYREILISGADGTGYRVKGLSSSPTATIRNPSFRQVISGYLWTINGNATVLASAKMRDLYIDPIAYPAFPIYASTGQDLASVGAGGLSFDGNARLRITETLPSALTRTNLLAADDFTDPSNWATASTELTYNDGVFHATGVASSGSSTACSFSHAIAWTGLDMRNSVRVWGGIAGETVKFEIRRVGGTLAQDIVEYTFLGTETETNPGFVFTDVVTGLTGNTAILLGFRGDLSATSDDFYFKLPTIENYTSYPAGVPPITIPVDHLGAELLDILNFTDGSDGGSTVTVANDIITGTDAAGACRYWNDGFTTIVGHEYVVYAEETSGEDVGLFGGTTPHTAGIFSTSIPGNGSVTYSFTAASTTTYISITDVNGFVVEGLSVKQLGAIEVPAQTQLPGGMRASGPTQELIVFGEQEVIHQGVGLTNEGYVADYLTNTLLAEALVWLDESSIVGDGQVTAWTNQGSGGSDYDLDTVVGTAANLTILPNDAARTTGVAGDYFSTPDSAAASITGDIDIRWHGALDDWDTAAQQELVAKYFGSGTRRSYRFGVNSAGNLVFDYSTDGTYQPANVITSGVVNAYPNGTLKHVRATFDASVPEVTFYDSDDGIAWTTISTVAGDGTSIFDTAEPVEIGSANSGAANLAAGKVISAHIYSTIGGTTPAVDFSPSLYESGSTFTGPDGETWTLNGDAFINKTGQSVVNAAGVVGMESAADQSIASPATVFVVAKLGTTPDASQYTLLDERTAGARFFNAVTGSDTFVLNQGASSISAGAADSDPHVWTSQFNGDATTKLTVSDVGDVTADAGAESWNYISLLKTSAELNHWEGWIGELIVFPRTLTATEIADMQNYLEGKWL